MAALVATPVSLSDRLAAAAAAWAQSQYQLVTLAAELADSPEWIVAGSPTPAHHLAAIADIETCTAREWLRVGKRVRGLPTIAERFADGTLSYSKVRALITVATEANQAELVAIAVDTPASQLRLALARWLDHNVDPDDLAAHQHQRRSLTWRNEADGTVTFTLRLPPHIAAVLIAIVTAIVMRTRPRPRPHEPWPTLAQQHADAIHHALVNGTGPITTEVVLHVRGDGASTDDGTPIAGSAMADLVPHAFIRALVHDANRRPINASARRRHPSTRQKRVVKERDRACVDCGRPDLLEYDHTPPYHHTGHTLVEQLQLRCAPCHRKRHARG